MQELKYELMAKGSEDLEFHATNNTAGTRRRVLSRIAEIDSLRVHTLWIDKAFAAPNLQSEEALFAVFGKAMGVWVEKALVQESDAQVIMVFDSVLTGKKRNAFLKKLKPQLANLRIPYRVLFHPVKQDLNGQIADYFSWAMFRYLENGDITAYETLRQSAEWDDFNLFNRGKTIYWRQPKKT